MNAKENTPHKVTISKVNKLTSFIYLIFIIPLTIINKIKKTTDITPY